MNNAYTGFSTKFTPQSEPILGEKQVQNAAGGFVYSVGAFKQLERFLILGSEGGTFYVEERKLTKENAINTIAAIEADGRKAVDLIVGISEAGRAVKNDPAIFALALAASAKDADTRSYALSQLSKVCRIPTHLFHFITYIEQFRGWGRGLKRAVGEWYNTQELDRLAYSLVKYQQRDGWSNADVLRKAHVNPENPIRSILYKWVVDGEDGFKERLDDLKKLPEIVRSFETSKIEGANIPLLVKDYNLSREMLPTESLNDPKVWEALLSKMPLTALIRNLGNLSKCGLLSPLSDASKTVVAKLTDREALRKARVHPASLFLALKVYGRGQSILGKGVWPVVAAVTEALDEAFYMAFEFVEPTNQSYLVAIDVSGSMSAAIFSGGRDKHGSPIPGPITAREGAAAMALATIKVERNYEIVCFDTRVVAFHPKVDRKTSLKDLERSIPHGGATDCASPIKWAIDNKIKADNIVILTDNETWAGRFGHPSQVMRDYRNKLNPRTNIINIGMTATDCTINDPNDPRELSVAGFDAAVPGVIANFVKEN